MKLSLNLGGAFVWLALAGALLGGCRSTDFYLRRMAEQRMPTGPSPMESAPANLITVVADSSLRGVPQFGNARITKRYFIPAIVFYQTHQAAEMHPGYANTGAMRDLVAWYIHQQWNQNSALQALPGPLYLRVTLDKLRAPLRYQMTMTSVFALITAITFGEEKIGLTTAELSYHYTLADEQGRTLTYGAGRADVAFPEVSNVWQSDKGFIRRYFNEYWPHYQEIGKGIGQQIARQVATVLKPGARLVEPDSTANK